MRPLQGGILQLRVGDDGIHHAHLEGFLCAVVPAQEEDLTCTLLAHLASQVSGTVASIKGCDICIGLLEDGVLLAGECEVRHDV